MYVVFNGAPDERVAVDCALRPVVVVHTGGPGSAILADTVSAARGVGLSGREPRCIRVRQLRRRTAASDRGAGAIQRAEGAPAQRVLFRRLVSSFTTCCRLSRRCSRCCWLLRCRLSFVVCRPSSRTLDYHVVIRHVDCCCLGFCVTLAAWLVVNPSTAPPRSCDAGRGMHLSGHARVRRPIAR